MNTRKLLLVATIACFCSAIACSAQSINMSGYAVWTHKGRAAGMSTTYITNHRPAGTISGTLVLRLWACRTPYTGGAFSGYKLAEGTLGQLRGGTYWYAPSVGGTWTVTTPGTFYIVMTLAEWTGSSWGVVDYVNFPPVRLGRTVPYQHTKSVYTN